LSEYYRSATDSEVQNFCAIPLLDIADKDHFLTMADTWIRRKIAIINDAGKVQSQLKSWLKTADLILQLQTKDSYSD
jgi:hypothetical protein